MNCSTGLVRALRYFSMALCVSLLLVGCSVDEGSVAVDVGTAQDALGYRVDIYAMEPGLDLVEGAFLSEGREVLLKRVPAGRWALLIQALDGNSNTVSHYQDQIEVAADETTSVVAGHYRPGMPGDYGGQSSVGFERFGPDGEALLSVLYAPSDLATTQMASLELSLSNGQGESSVAAQSVVMNRALPMTDEELRCGTSFVSLLPESDEPGTLNQGARPRPGDINPGETLDFFVATSYKRVDCERLLDDDQTQSCLIFAEVVDGQAVLSEDLALDVVEAFEQQNPFLGSGSQGIYRDTQARFGTEWLTGGGRDGDERVVLVFLSASTLGSPGLFGYFYPVDEMPQSKSANSNEAEILYLNADRAQKSFYDILGTLSHELTHLILYNQKVARDGAFPPDAKEEMPILDEGLAVLNEELSGFSFDGPDGGNFFLISAVEELLNEGLERPYFRFQGRLSDYGAGYLLWRFIYDHYGIETITRLSTSPDVGLENLETVLDEPFAPVFARFTQALALNGHPDAPSEWQFDGLDLWATYTTTAGAVHEFQGLQGINEVALPGSLSSSVELEPWATVIYRVTGGQGEPLTWGVEGQTGEVLVDVVGLRESE